MKNKYKPTNSTKKLPFIVVGIFLYFVLYIVAAAYYPGGSNFNTHEKGFHILSNYWCELLSKYAKNGQLNKARPFGFVAMLILAFSLSYFWWKIPDLLHLKNWQVLTLRWSGIFSMLFSLLIFTDFHDTVIGASVVLGTLAFLLTIYGLSSNGFSGFATFGTICLLLIFINMFIYLTNQWIELLPITQKATFVLVFVWIGSISFQLEKMNKDHETL
jgi:hypothetical protein